MPFFGGGGGGSQTVELETPSGAVNGANRDFVFTSAPIIVFYQGIAQTEGIDYTLTDSTATFAVAPVSGSVRGLITAS